MTEAFAAQRARLLELLRQLAYEEREVILASGRPSNFYIDCKQAVLTAEGHFLVGWLINQVLERAAPEVRAVGGLTMGADPLASATATVSFLGPRPRAAFYVRKEPKAHGTQKWIEGDKTVVPGTPVAVLEDVITTGGSTLKAIERARLHGLEVRHVVALVDREEGGREAVEREAPVTSLYKQSDFR
ncbi:MAG TPA: orotate phosphoribosyltransferase [Polyangia bacterium]|jgi:orotate phosphoribosyltransferase|nr:orotate phosphoribosyltransferase [Polyangia bacterium]